MARDYEPNPEDERVVDLADETEPPPSPPTIDPDERIEEDGQEIPPLDDDRDGAG